MGESGGNEWERRKAFEMYKAARIAGDIDAEIVALSRTMDALVNMVVTELAKQSIPIRIEMRVIKAQHQEDSASQAHVNSMIIDLETASQAEQGKQAAQIGILSAAQTTTEHALQEHIERQADDERMVNE